MNSQLQDTHAQISGESEFYALGAGCTDGLYVKSDPERSRHASQDRTHLYASTDRNELGRHRHETLAMPQIGIPQEFDGKELR